MNTASKAEMLETLRALLRDVFRLRSDGVAYARLARANGYADGYMRALLERGIVDKNELLAIVAQERTGVDGPATTTVSPEVTAA